VFVDALARRRGKGQRRPGGISAGAYRFVRAQSECGATICHAICGHLTQADAFFFFIRTGACSGWRNCLFAAPQPFAAALPGIARLRKF